jgi:hypothetical protein
MDFGVEVPDENKAADSRTSKKRKPRGSQSD